MVTDKDIVDALGMVQTFWAPLTEQELREQHLWLAILQDPRYTLEKVAGGDTYKVSYINKSSSNIRTIGVDADSFDTNVLSSTQVDLTVNKLCMAAYEFTDFAELQSQLNDAEGKSEIRESLLADVGEQGNDWVKSNISPSTSSPAHVLSSVTDFNNAQLSTVRSLGAVSKWGTNTKYLLADPIYYGDMIDDTTISAANIMGTDKSPMIAGQFALQRYGFNILEDDSLSTDTAFAFIPSFMRVIFGQPEFQLSDLHSQKKNGWLLSVKYPMGLVQLDNKRVISIEN